MNRNNLIWGGLAVIAVAVIAVAIFSPFPPKDDLSGAVGVAKQHRNEQITDADVALKDPEIQNLLQSDFFYKLATDEAFRKVAVDQFARLDIASGRTAQFTHPTSLADMDNFLAMTVENADLKTALSAGRMDIVRKILIADGKAPYIDIANRIYLTQGRSPQINARSYAEMRSFLELAKTNIELRNALADGRIELVNRILVKDGKVELQEPAGRVFLAESRCHFSGRVYAFADLKVFFDLMRSNVEMRNALTEGRMDIVRKVLLAEGRGNLEDVAKRVYITAGRGQQPDAATLDNLQAFIDLAADNRDLRVAFTDGRMDVVNKILVADGKVRLSEEVGRVFAADGRLQIDSPASLSKSGELEQAASHYGDGKAGGTPIEYIIITSKRVLDHADTNPELRNALADGRMDIVRKMLVADGKANLLDPAHRVYLSLGRHSEVNVIALEQMKSFVDAAHASPEMRTALAEGRMEVVRKMLVADGKIGMEDAAGKNGMQDAVGRVVYFMTIDNPVSREYGIGSRRAAVELRQFLDLAKVNVELRSALADGRMDIVNKVLVADGRTYLENAAGRVFLSLGRSPQLSAATVDQMRSVFEAVDANAGLRSALADGRLDIARKVLVTDGKSELEDAAGRVVYIMAIDNPVSRDYALGSLRAASDFAAESADFRQALQEGRIEMAARVARAAGRSDISLRGLQITSFVVGDSRNYIADLGRIAAVAGLPTFRQAAESPGWGRVLATADSADWKLTVEAVGEGKMYVAQ